MQTTLTPPGNRQPSGRKSHDRTPWIVLFSLVLLLAALAVVLILPSLMVSESELPESAQPGVADRQQNRELTQQGDNEQQALSESEQPAQAGSYEKAVVPIQQRPVEQPVATPLPETSPEVTRDETQELAAEARVQAFRDAMSDALNALEQHNLAAARKALSKAELIQPGSAAVQEGQVQVRAATRARALQDLRVRAARSERQEAWQEAARLYGEALIIDPLVAFAEAGKARAARRLAIERAIDHYLQQPERLQADQPLANAQRLLTQLEEMRDSGPKLRDKVARLARLVAEAETLLPVRIRSDHVTDVVIYRVGRLGRFGLRELDLKPGTYTVVGRREGFRDVRKVFTLVPGETIDITVRCEESI